MKLKRKPYLDGHLLNEARGEADDGVQLGLDGVDEARVACKRRGVACVCIWKMGHWFFFSKASEFDVSVLFSS